MREGGMSTTTAEPALVARARIACTACIVVTMDIVVVYPCRAGRRRRRRGCWRSWGCRLIVGREARSEYTPSECVNERSKCHSCPRVEMELTFSATPHSTPPPDYREREPYTPVPPSQAFAREREQREREAHSSSTPSHPPLPANYARTHPQQQQRFAPPPPSNLYRRSSQHAHLPPPPSQTPIYAQHAQHSSHAQHPSHAQHAQHPSQHPHPSHAQQPFGLTQEEYDRQREEQRKLEERAREQAHYDRALAQSQREQWDAHTREQSKLANIATLHQMFPALDEEIVQVVLEASGEDLGAAIDRLLEM